MPESSIDEIRVRQADRVCRIEINRPEKKNSLTRPMYHAMAEAIERAEADPAVRVIFLHGRPDCFCAGNDLQEFKAVSESGEGRPEGSNPFMTVIAGAEKPMVAAVGGPAIGIGTTMLLHFDLVYAGENARFALPFVNLGLCPEAASSFLLPRLMGHQRAAGLLLTGEPFSSARAYELGLVHKVCPDAEVIDRAYEQAGKLAQKPPAAMRLTKSLIKRHASHEVAQIMADELRHFNERLVSGECREALNAFLERRDPDFSAFE